MYIGEISRLAGRVTDDVIHKLDAVYWPTAVPDAAIGCIRAISIGLSGFDHAVQWSIKSLPVAIKLMLNQVPIALVKRISNGIYVPPPSHLQIHSTHVKNAINSLFPFGTAQSVRRNQPQRSDELFNLTASGMKRISGRTLLKFGAAAAFLSAIWCLRLKSELASVKVMYIGHEAWTVGPPGATFMGLISVSAVALTYLGVRNNNITRKYQEKLRQKDACITRLNTDLARERDTLRQRNLFMGHLNAELARERAEIKRLNTRVQSLTADKLNNLALQGSRSQFDPSANLKMSREQEELYDDICKKLGFNCSLSIGPFENPVTLINGQTYSRSLIEHFLETSGGSCKDPNTRRQMPENHTLTPNNIITSLMTSIQCFLPEHPDKESVTQVISQLPDINIEDPVLIIEPLGDLPPGMTISKAEALEINPQAEAEWRIVPNYALKSYMEQRKACLPVEESEAKPANNESNINVISNSPKDQEALRAQRLKVFGGNELPPRTQ